jgi:hypothetical protein
VSFVAASVPDKPTDTPQLVSPMGTEPELIIKYATPTSPNDGGSPILSYALEMDNGQGGAYTQIVGHNTHSMLTSYTVNVIKGTQYRFRYRAKNAVGFGEYSDHSVILAAGVPSPVPKPLYSINFDSNVLYLDIQQSPDNGGSEIIRYDLYRAEVIDNSPLSYSKVSSFIFDNFRTTIVEGPSGYTQGITYAFQVVAVNSIGESDPSEAVYASISDVPPQPNAISTSISSISSITIEWDQVVSSLPVTGYVVLMNSPETGDDELNEVYIASASTLQYTATNLETGLPYTFAIQAINENGRSIPSDSFTAYA